MKNTNKTNGLKNMFREKSDPLIIEWVIIGILFMMLFLSYNYWDLIITTRHSINVWDSLFSGKIMNFYSDNLAAPITNYWTFPAIYSFPIYILFAIWNFPLWCLEHFMAIDPFTSRLALTYAKLILLPFLIGAAKMLYNICKEMKIKEALWCVIYFFTGCLVVSAITVQGQYDIISIFFTLTGIYYYLKGSMPKFIFWFAVAIVFKLFAMFIFIPLILLKEKKIHRIVLQIGLVSSLYLLSMKLTPVLTPEAVAVNVGHSGSIFKNTLPLFVKPVPIFVIATIILYFYCYFQNSENNIQWKAIFVSYLSMAILFVFSYSNPYWNIIMAPYMSILVFKSVKNIRFNMLVETVFSASMTLGFMLTNNIPFSIWNVNNSLLADLFEKISGLRILVGDGNFPLPQSNLISIEWLINTFIHNELIRTFFQPLFTGIMAASAIVFTVVNYWLIQDKQLFGDSFFAKKENTIRNFIWGRSLVNIFICSLPILTYVIAAMTL